MNMQMYGAAVGSTKKANEYLKPLRLTNVGTETAQCFFETVSAKLQIRRSTKERFKDWDVTIHESIYIEPGDFIELIGDNSSVTGGLGQFILHAADHSSRAPIHASGNVMSIVYGENLTEENMLIMPSGLVFGINSHGLFENTLISHAPLLPATTLETPSVYARMFRSCAQLLEAPLLPAKSIPKSGYESMFEYCQKLETAPELPATLVEEDGYKKMFSACQSLKTIAKLPEIISGGKDFAREMYHTCTSLTKVEVPIEPVTEGCFAYMFDTCTSLSEITVYFTQWNPNNATPSPTQYWLEKVADSGTFKCPAALDTTTRDSSHIPEGWTVEYIE